MMTPPAVKTYALITGASGGIGEAIARRLAEEGYSLILVARSAEKLHALAASLTSRHAIDVRVMAHDLTRREAADELAAQLAGEGLPVDVLVNNAGFGLFGMHANTALSEEQHMIDLNITALTRLTKLMLPPMLARNHGRILNVASTAAFQPGPFMAVYYATKAYVLSYSEALHEELRGTGVTVTALCPGPTASDFQARAAMQNSGLVKGKRLPDATEVADFGVSALLRGRSVAIHGWMNWFMTQSVRFTPRALVVRIVAAMSRPA